MSTSVVPEKKIEARLRAKNQLTLPEEVVKAIGAEVGDRFLIAVDGPDTLTLFRARKSYAGAFPGMWGDTDEEIAAHLRELRENWDRSIL